MGRLSDETLIAVLPLRPVIALAALALMASALVGVSYLVFSVGAALLVVIGLLDGETVRRAGSREAIEVWRASSGWTAKEFVLNHDFDPEGTAFADLLARLAAHGYSLTPDSNHHGTSTWRFARSSAA